ncbi:MAG: hypothetical protein R6X22_01080, partial [Gemmatimonadota bacterium]
MAGGGPGDAGGGGRLITYPERERINVNVKKLVLAAIAVGIAVNVFDFVVHGLLLGSTYASLPEVFRQENNVGWLVALDFLMALVFVWVYVRVRASFAPRATGGAAFGLYAGVLLGFPMQL